MINSINIALLLLGAFNGAVVLVLLLLHKRTSSALIVLCVFISLLVLRSIIYLLGAQSVYDPHSWLYVPPIEFSLAYGPCIFLYLRYITKQHFDIKDLVHFSPVVIQASYYLLILALSNQDSVDWMRNYHIPLVSKLEVILVSLSLFFYWYKTHQFFTSYQIWLNSHVSDAENYRMDWLKVFLYTTGLFFVLWTVSSIAQLWIEPSYNANFALFAGQSILLCLLSFESWRHAHLEFPQQASQNTDEHPENCTDKYEVLYKAWYEQIISNKWWQDPDLSLSLLAKRLGTNTTTLSMVINAVTGSNFNYVINQIRVEFVCKQIDALDKNTSLSELAYQAGFNSKNSFNRNFKRMTGLSPTQYKSTKS